MASQRSQKSAFRILVSTDNHIGFKEDHHIRGDDSFDAFEEILQLAKRNKVDFVLLGGDLFHELTPSPNCLYRTIRLLQKYVFGGGDLSYETKTMEGSYPANYLNENLNIDLPIFIIHGNHDHPMHAGENISTLDLLHASKLVNYFGKCKNLDELTIEPILFEKPNVKIALYGIGHIKDTRLHYLFEKKKVHFVPPPADGEYVNILIIHQNRFKGIRPGAPYKNCIHPTMLPSFMDVIIWGNEHESTESLFEDSVQNFYIYQPGSSVATSLNQAEALQKNAGFFEVSEKKNFKFLPIPLKNQRPLYVKNIELDQLLEQKKPSVFKNQIEEEEDDKMIEKTIESKIKEEFQRMMEEHETNIATQKRLKHPPLVRIKVEYSGFDLIRIKQVELNFMGKVANEGDVLKFWRKTSTKKAADLKKNKKLGEEFEETLRQKMSFETLTSESNDVIKGLIEDLMQNSTKKLKILPLGLFTQAPNQKFTLQGVSEHIEGTLHGAKKRLLTEKIAQSQTMSKKLLNAENEFVRSQYSNGETFLEDLHTQIKQYEHHMHEIPKFITQKLNEFMMKRNPEEDSFIKKEEDEDEDAMEIEEDNKQTTKRKKKEPAASKKTSKKGSKKPTKQEMEEEEDEKEEEMVLEKKHNWDEYEKNSEEEEKEWFKEDFGKAPEEYGTKKGRKTTTAADKPKGRGGRSKAAKKSEESDFDDELSYDSQPKKRGGKKRATPLPSDMEDYETDRLKKPKLTEAATTRKSAGTQNTAQKKTGKANKYFL